MTEAAVLQRLQLATEGGCSHAQPVNCSRPVTPALEEQQRCGLDDLWKQDQAASKPLPLVRCWGLLTRISNRRSAGAWLPASLPAGPSISHQLQHWAHDCWTTQQHTAAVEGTAVTSFGSRRQFAGRPDQLQLVAHCQGMHDRNPRLCGHTHVISSRHWSTAATAIHGVLHECSCMRSCAVMLHGSWCPGQLLQADVQSAGIRMWLHDCGCNCLVRLSQ
jgi:hypothetical protein